MTDMKNEFILLGRAIVTVGVWIAYGLSLDENVFWAAVTVTVITGSSSET